MKKFKSFFGMQNAMTGKNILKRNWQWIFLGLAVVMSIYFRIINPSNSVFSWTVILGGNDPWYYFRLVENCLAHFPSRIWFDAFTNYPYGTYIHFGPFLVYLSAIFAKLAGASNSESIRSVLAFIPAIGGTLLAFSTYLFTKEVFNKKAGVIAALLVVSIPGQLLHRSMLGFNDHHIWEVFWMVSVFALFVYSVNLWSGRGAKENLNDKKMLFAPVLSGLALGLYLDTWAPGFIAALILVVYAFIVFLMKKHIVAETENLTYIGIVTFLIASIVYLPFSFIYPGLNTVYYSPFQLLILLGSALTLAVFLGIELLEKKGYYAKLGIKEDYAFPATIVAVSVVIIGGISAISPDFLNLLKSIVGVVQPKGGALTIAEVQPFFTMRGEFSLAPAWRNFSMTFFFAIPGMFYTGYRLLKERKSLYLLALIWGVAMFIALVGQNRFAYYFGAVSAVFAAVMLDVLLDKLKFYDAINGAIKNGWDGIKRVSYFRLIIAILFILHLFYPTISEANTQSKYAGGINKQWYDTLVWMRENTPGKDFYDKYYYELYKPPEKLGEPYPYPDGTYGVMSWWDYGHWITAIAHRIPNANPFQQGIGNKYNDVPGAAPFFTAFNESYANRVADKLGVKFVISDVEMATGKFYAMATWAEGSLEKAGSVYYRGPGYVYITPDNNIGIAFSRYKIPANSHVITAINVPSENYYRTMEARLHIFDGYGLKHYRMVYESEFEAKNRLTMEILYRLIYNGMYAQKLGLPAVNVTSTGYVKVFEYVKGAKIKGKVPEGVEEVTLKTTIQTNQGRIFIYEQKVKPENGTYEFIVPYAQDTKYPVKPTTPYVITAGNVTKEISLSDNDVENGNEITVDLT